MYYCLLLIQMYFIVKYVASEVLIFVKRYETIF